MHICCSGRLKAFVGKIKALRKLKLSKAFVKKIKSFRQEDKNRREQNGKCSIKECL
jgi:hypothetical protein